MKPVICFGEIMARFSPPGHLRFGQAMPGTLEVTFAGAEANVAVAIARLGGAAEFVSALPANPLGEAALAGLRAAGVAVGGVLCRDEGRCGLYFVETGAGHRGGVVIYDRDASTFALTSAEAYAWCDRLRGAGWLHITGISPGVSRMAAAATQAAVEAAKRAGVTVSCDLNFRRKLWRWEPGVSAEELARRTQDRFLPFVDVLIGNPHDLAAQIGASFVADAGDLGAARELARQVLARFPQLRWLAMTLRENHSASRNCWGALLLRGTDGALFTAPQSAGRYAPYEIHTIIDRVGTGDVFAGALIHALRDSALNDPSRALAFATAASCLAHSTFGDYFQGTRTEVETLMQGDGAGHLSR